VARRGEDVQDDAQQKSEPPEEEAKVVALISSGSPYSFSVGGGAVDFETCQAIANGRRIGSEAVVPP
jgi:hypothetical protein